MNTTEAQTIANIATNSLSAILADVSKLVQQSHDNHMALLDILPAEERKAFVLAEMASYDKALTGVGAGLAKIVEDGGRAIQAQEALRAGRPDKRAEAELVSAEARLVSAKAEAVRVANQHRQWETERADRLAAQEPKVPNGVDKADALRAKVPVGGVGHG